jgi:hypothetical protein
VYVNVFCREVRDIIDITVRHAVVDPVVVAQGVASPQACILGEVVFQMMRT